MQKKKYDTPPLQQKSPKTWYKSFV